VQTHPGTVYRFGPFEVNAASGELLKNGRSIRLQEQPYRLLLVLLETPGEVVSREELRSRLWSGNTFVDFDGSLRVAVRKLREALDDSAEDPRYIETIPKRGYRFLVPEVRRTDAPPEIAEPNDDLEHLNTGASPLDASHTHNPLLKYGIAALAALILTAGGVFFWQ
jgi:DNA-binding winged helix-turn-helix (wHTH) protein